MEKFNVIYTIGETNCKVAETDKLENINLYTVVKTHASNSMELAKEFITGLSIGIEHLFYIIKIITIKDDDYFELHNC